MRIDPLPQNVAQDCARPETFLGIQNWEVMVRRMGNELIACGAEKRAAVGAYEKVRKTLTK